MNKHFLLLIYFLFATAILCADEVYVGYCDGNNVDNTVDGLMGTDRSAAICLSSGEFWMYQGSSITGLRLGFGGSVTNLSVFIRRALDGETLYSESFGAQSSGWHDFAFATPFVIPEGDIYVGYTCKGASAIGLSGEAYNNGCWVMGTGAWRDYVSENKGSACIQAVVDGDTYAFTDAALLRIDDVLAASGESFAVHGIVRNNTNMFATEMVVEYSVAGGTPVRKTAATEILPGEIGGISFLADAVTAIGSHRMEVSVTEINGRADEHAANSTLPLTLSVVGKRVPRTIVLEYFTTQLCPNCPTAQAMWNNVLKSRSDVVWVAHHSGFYTDAFTIDDHERMLWFYNSGGAYYAPAGMLDRTNLASYGATNGTQPTPGPVFFANNQAQMEALLSVREAVPAPLAIDILRDYDADTRQLAIRTTVERVEGMSVGDHPVLNIFLVEDGLQGEQSGASGSFVHDHVVRHFVTPTWGEAVSFANGNSWAANHTATLPAAWNAQKMTIVAFVSNYNANNVNDCEVYNAATVSLPGNDGTAIGATPAAARALVYPNPSDGRFTVDTPQPARLRICDLAGKEVHRQSLESGTNRVVTSLPAGANVLSVEGEASASIHKIMIK